MEIVLEKVLSSLLLFFTIIRIGNSLECYVCTNQDHNTGKCLNTITTCEYGEDVCLSEIRWGTLPYWSQGADKQYYLSKRCAKKDTCVQTRSKNMPYCTYIWYQDWKCSECCQGDRCNYFVFVENMGTIRYTKLSGSMACSSVVVLSLGVAAVLSFRWFYQV